MTSILGNTTVKGATGVNLNQSANTVLMTLVAHKPLLLQRFGVIADASEGLLAAMRLKMRKTTIADGTVADLTGMGTLDPGGTKARGKGVYKDAEDYVRVDAGDKVTIAVDTSAGGTSTGDVFIEYIELPFSGSGIDAFSASA